MLPELQLVILPSLCWIILESKSCHNSWLRTNIGRLVQFWCFLAVVYALHNLLQLHNNMSFGVLFLQKNEARQAGEARTDIQFLVPLNWAEVMFYFHKPSLLIDAMYRKLPTIFACWQIIIIICPNWICICFSLLSWNALSYSVWGMEPTRHVQQISIFIY